MAIDLGNTPTGTPPSPAEKLQIRSAIGVGATDAPTFLAQTLTGQSLTGVQATSLLDLSTTWLSATGNPTAIKLNVTNTASGASSNLMDLQIDGVSKVRTSKGAELKLASGGSFALTQNGSGITGNRCILLYDAGVPTIATGGQVAWSQGGDAGGGVNTFLTSDAAGILAQRNGTSTQQFRVYNTISGVSGVDYERGFMRYATGLLEIGYEFGGLGGSRSVQITTPGDVYLNGTGTGSAVGFKTNGVLRAYFDNGGKLLFNLDNTYDIGASGANRPRNVFANSLAIGSFLSIASESGISPRTNTAGSGPVLVVETSTNWTAGVARFRDTKNGWSIYVPSVTDATIQLGGTTSAFPAIKRNGTGIDIKLADDSAFAPVKGKITTDTAYTAGASAATGFITIFDSTGTAYRVWCTPA